jgi:thiol-disulfide isomerase/thioredoxin
MRLYVASTNGTIDMRFTKCCILLLFIPYVNAATEPDLVEEIFLAQRQNFMRLKSISMIYSEDWEPSVRNSRHIVFGFKKEGEKFRVDTALDGTKVSPDDKNSINSRITAFDLDKYQRFDKRSRWLDFMDRDINPLEEGNLPLIMPYRYLFLTSRLSFKNIQDKAFWDRLKRDIKNTQKAMIEGQDCIRTDISFSDKARLCQIYWAKEFGFYPIKIQVSNLDGKKLVEITVKEVMKQETTNGPVFIPMVMEQMDWPETGGYKSWTWRHTIDSNSLSVNEDIPDEVFTIPLHMAKRITDFTNSWNNYNPENATAYAMKGKPSIEFTLPKFGGENVTLSQEKAKIVILDFWTTWCGSCIAALPGLERVQKWAIENELSVSFYCINVKEGPEKVESFRSKHKIRIPILMDEDNVVREKYNVPGVSTMLIIANGTIQHVHIGGGGAQEMLLRQENQLKEEIKALLIELGEKGDCNEQSNK